MKMRTGLVVGFAVGYYLGAKAGRERYEQLRNLLEGAGPLAKVRAAVDLASERLRDAVDSDPFETVVPPSSN